MRTLLILSLAGLGCAATIPTELAEARDAYNRAASGPAATLVPAELHKAEQALEQAEQAFEDDPDNFNTLDLAYVATRKSQIAEAMAMVEQERRSREAAESAFATAQEDAFTRSREELSAAQQRADQAMQRLQQLEMLKQEPRGLVITLSGSVLFRSDESVLLPEAQVRLDEVAQALEAAPDRDILVEGHTDAQGSEAYNLSLSQRRADAVREVLVRSGYDAGRIRAVGVGEARPVGDNESAEGRAINRRVEIVLANGGVDSAPETEPPEPQ